MGMAIETLAFSQAVNDLKNLAIFRCLAALDFLNEKDTDG